MAAAQRAGTHRRAMRAGGARALNADRGDLDRRAFAYLSADRASPVRAGRQSALGVEVPHDVAAGDAARGTFRAGGIHCGRERSAREGCPGPPHLQPLRAFLPAAFDRRIAAASERSAGRNVAGGSAALRAFLPAAFDRRIAAASERSAGRNVAGGSAADHGLRVEAALSPPRGRSAGCEAGPLRPVADYGAEWADLRAAPGPRSGVGAQPFAQALFSDSAVDAARDLERAERLVNLAAT